MNMKAKSKRISHRRLLWRGGVVACMCLCASVLLAVAQSKAQDASASTAESATRAKNFDTPQQAADALVAAAEKFDVPELIEIFGPGGDDIVLTGEYPQDRQRAFDFAAQAHEKQGVSLDRKRGSRAFLMVGNENWPFPVPIVKTSGKWSFDAKAGR